MGPEKIIPRVSIVIPVYNGSNYLKEAIDSALAQTYGNVEIIVVNDGSDDNGATEKVAKSYGARIKYYYKKNGGVATALNLGIEKMTGSYFSWLSHDDLYEKTKIKDQITYISKLDRKDVIVASNTKALFASGIKKKFAIDSETFKFIDIFLATSALVGVNGCSLLIPREAFEICGGFNVDLPVTQDYDLWFRMKDKYGFVLLEKYLVVSRRHTEQDSVKKKKLLYDAGDQLHYSFLKTITYERFEEYFKHGRKNIEHAYENYKAYKLRGYAKTSSLLLKNIMRYCYENDKDKFYRIFESEIELSQPNPTNTRIPKKLTDNDRRRINLAYVKLLESDTDSLPIKKPSIAYEASKSKPLRFIGSVKQDGLYLAAEKVARKVYKKMKR